MRPQFSLALLTLLASPAFVLAQESVGGGGNLPPVCDSGGPYTFDCNNMPGTSFTRVQLDGSASYDPEGDSLSYFWFYECPYLIFDDQTAIQPLVDVDMTGVCTRTCLFELRLSDPFHSSATKCFDSLTVTDMSAPVISCPADVYQIWDANTAANGPDPLVTGSATATDNCDANPVITYSDVKVFDTIGSGLELHFDRTWTATDMCGFSSSCLQTVYLTSPNAGGSNINLDLDVESCPNLLDRTTAGTLDVVVLAGKKLNAIDVDLSTLRIQRMDLPGLSMSIAGFSPIHKDIGRVTAKFPGDCNSTKNDGKKDVVVKIDRETLIGNLSLGSLPAGQEIELGVFFLDLNGRTFLLRDEIVLQ